ncbi:MAG: response regulator [Planctomycetaceae bacterium]|nr:response regulator [Planctomycetaceae bacterium]
MITPNGLNTLLCLLLCGSLAHAQQASPQLRYFAPEDYQGGWQVFGMAQDHEGRIYAAVPDDGAVYCFDGANWDRIDMPSAPLTIQADASGRIYVGHDSGISRLQRDAAGRTLIKPLEISFDDQDPRHVGIPLRGAALPGYDLTFANSRMVFDVRPDKVRVWKAEGDDRFVGRVADVNYVRHRCEPGVFRLQGEERTAVPGLESVSVNWILSTNRHVLVLTTSEVLILQDGQTRPFSEELADAMPPESSIYWCWPNRDGTVSVGTTTGFYCCDADGRLLYHIDRSNGLETDVIVSVFQDWSGDLWLSTEVGLAHVSHSSRDSVYTIRNSERRLTDLLYTMESSVLVGRRGDPYIVDIPSMRTTPIPQLKEQVLVEAAECRGQLFAAASDMICQIEGSSVTPVLERRATAMSFSVSEDFAALALMEDVVEILAIAPDGKWSPIQTVPIQHRFASMKVADNGDILGISFDGTSIARIRFDGDWNSKATVDYFETPPAQLLMSETFVLIVSSAGWLDYDPTVSDGFPFVPAGCLQSIDYRNAGMATFTREADLLVAGNRQIQRYPLDRKTEKYSEQWNRKVLAAADIACEPVEVDGWLCVAHADGLSVYRDGTAATSLPASVRPVISLAGGAVNASDHQVTATPGSSVRFHFATPVFPADCLMEYQVRLLPSQTEWSEWSEESSVEYADLAPGMRTFQVRSRVRGQTDLTGNQTAIRVVPFWYQTATARLSAVAGLILLLGGMIHLRERKVTAGKQRLEAEVRSRTALLADANAQLQDKIRVAAESEKAREELAVRYQESERLESLGAMAGGIAHDFNNLLAVIVMQTELLKLTVRDSESDALNSISVIEATTDTAAQMCRQILAASCSSPLENRLISLHDLVRELHPLLRTSVTPHPLKLELELHADRFCGDASQIKQVILNLVVNAREAQTEDRATLTVRTGQSTLTWRVVETLRCVGERPMPGEYVWVCVSDPGPGLDEQTQRRMFDPFYSTKAPGRGLGMATVLQTSSRHGGGVAVSRVNGQTQIYVYLPVSHQVTALPVDQTLLPSSADESMKVLLVDDEPSVRESASLLLQERDFEVVAAASGEEGLRIFRENPDQINLAILDISLPGMNGHEVATKLLSEMPELPIVMMSGFSEETVAEEIVARPTVTFLKKPFRSQGLYSACTTVTGRRTG